MPQRPQLERPRPRTRPQPKPRRVWWLSWVDAQGRELSRRYRANFRLPDSDQPLSMPEVEGAVGVKVWWRQAGGKELVPSELFEDVR